MEMPHLWGLYSQTVMNLCTRAWSRAWSNRIVILQLCLPRSLRDAIQTSQVDLLECESLLQSVFLVTIASAHPFRSSITVQRTHSPRCTYSPSFQPPSRVCRELWVTMLFRGDECSSSKLISGTSVERGGGLLPWVSTARAR